MKIRKTIVCLLLCAVLTVAVCASGFVDVKDSDWFAPAVEYCEKNGLMKGTDIEVFSPKTYMSRAMLAAVLHRMSRKNAEPAAENPFSDVPAGKWFTADVLWAYRAGIAAGTPEGKFLPNANVTRQDAACMIARFLDFEGVTPDTDRAAVGPFTDMNSVSAYAKSAVELLRQTGLSSGNGKGAYLPKSNLSRAEAAVLLMNLDKLIAAQTPEPPETETTEPAPTETGTAGDWIEVVPAEPDSEGWLPLIP